MDAVERLCITLDGRRYENRSVSQVSFSILGSGVLSGKMLLVRITENQ